MSDDIGEKLAGAFDRLRTRGICMLCGGSSTVFGAFFPKPEFAERLGQPEGKQRIVAYALCDQCVELPDRDARVESRFLEVVTVPPPLHPPPHPPL